MDRDGTLIEEHGYLDRLDLLSVFPWTADAIRLLNRAGFAAVVVTNQAAVARGIIAEEFVATVHRELDARLGRARVDAYYYCPHLADSRIERYRRACGCRKPEPGMIEQACRDLDLDASRSFMVGDRWPDVVCGRRAGTRSILVRTGHGGHAEERPPAGEHADAILNNLMEAVGWILRSSSR
jgi:D-glycero-D-manno-heptose 1,7-bisphosphate phosphatase